MNRYEFENLISDYLDGSIPFKKREEFEDYIKNNPEANSLVEDVKNTIFDMNNLHKIKVNTGFNKKLLSRLKKERLVTLSDNKILGFTPFYASVLSCLCIAFFVVSFQLLNLSSGSNINSKSNQFTADSEQSIPPIAKNLNLDNNYLVDSDIDTLDDKKEKEKPNNSNKIKFVNY